MKRIRFPRGSMKPPIGAVINPSHPFAKGHILSMFCNEGRYAVDGLTSGGDLLRIPAISYVGPNRPIDSNYRSTGPTKNITWSSNNEGHCVFFDNASSGDYFVHFPEFIPTDAVTFLLIGHKTDTTLRNCMMCGVDPAFTAERANIYLPYGDGVVYWDFGGTSGANRLTVSGLTFATRIAERWIFSAGPRGSAIWRDGIKIASQTTAITRTHSTTRGFFWSSDGGLSPDLYKMNFFAAYNYQWDDDTCRWWSAEPYAHLYPSRLDLWGVNPASVVVGSSVPTFRSFLVSP